MPSEGGKVAGLRALVDFAPVPPFVVVSGDQGVEDASALTETMIRAGVRPPFAVRSSADVEDGDSAAFAGMFETRLRVAPDDLEEAVSEVASSLDSARLDAYLEASGGGTGRPGRMHVIVQTMVDSRVSGVCVSRLPEDTVDAATIEAVWGLGEMLVSGTVEPDRYRVRRSDRGVEVIEIGNQVLQLTLSAGEQLVPASKRQARKLSADEAVAISRIAFEAEQRLGWEAADIEWAIEGEKLWALQARPVASVAKVAPDESA